MAITGTLEITGREVVLSNLDKVLWPENGYTKKDLIDYYVAVFPFIAPHINQRPLVFTRYPNGIDAKSFYQKNAPPNLPDWIKTFPWAGSEGEPTNYILVNSAADLAWLANLACIEIHPWLSQIGSLDFPDFIVFDLDPSNHNSWAEIVTVANLLKQIMDQLGLRIYAKTSGSLGLHVYLPIVNHYTYSRVRDFSQAIAAIICRVVPDIATIKRSVQHRGPRIYIDYLQNGLGKTVCAPYSVRPRPTASVSTPIKWEELSSINPVQFTIKTVPERLNRHGDLFKEVLSDRQELELAIQSLGI
ncbi:MAG: non-homologous end-joining DNA ligase [Syntrophomonadaceae bacterium]|jgi:bifunctional non-homologous end joining protein LigD